MRDTVSLHMATLQLQQGTTQPVFLQRTPISHSQLLANSTELVNQSVPPFLTSLHCGVILRTIVKANCVLWFSHRTPTSRKTPTLGSAGSQKPLIECGFVVPCSTSRANSAIAFPRF